MSKFVTEFINRIKNISSFRKSHRHQSRGIVNIIAQNGGLIDVHPTTLLNSNQTGYHAGMPFETTLIAVRPGARIKIGANCRIHGTYINAWKSIIIGQGVLIAAGTNIMDSNGHSSNIRYARFRRFFNDEPKEIIIDDYVWIGINSTILKGVKIGECSIVSAGSVVKNNVPPFSIVEGNPARVIYSFNPKEALPESYPIEKLRFEEGYYEY